MRHGEKNLDVCFAANEHGDRALNEQAHAFAVLGNLKLRY